MPPEFMDCFTSFAMTVLFRVKASEIYGKLILINQSTRQAKKFLRLGD